MPDLGKLMQNVDEVKREEMTIFYVLDTSDNMKGQPIVDLNRAVVESTEALKELAKDNGNVRLKIAVLEFNSNCKWITVNGSESLEGDFMWQDLEAVGERNISSALIELNNKLSESQFLGSMEDSFMPIIIFMTNAAETDDYKESLEEIRKNKWYNHATKIGFVFGDTENQRMIANLVRNSESVINTTDMELFKKLVRFVKVLPEFLDMKEDGDNEKSGENQKVIVKNPKVKITMEFSPCESMNELVALNTKSFVDTILSNGEEKTLNLTIESKNTYNQDLTKRVVIELYETSEVDNSLDDDWDDEDW